MSTVMGRSPRAIFRLVGHLLLKPRYYPVSLFGLLHLWWVKRTRRQVRLEVVCTLWWCCRHIKLQAYQSYYDLLKDMDEGEDIKNDDIAELRRATDLSL